MRFFLLPLLVMAACGTRSPRGDGAASGQTVIEQPSAPAVPLAPLAAASSRPAAPGFEGGGAWLNTTRPLTTSELRGRVVVVDFWTSCCINCLQTLPTLRAVEAHFPAEEVVVVGVQSPKFPAERDPERLADFLAQHDVVHPVVVDPDMAIWRSWGVRAWPTVLVLDTEGRIVWRESGEPDLRELFGVVQGALAEGRERGTLRPGRVDGVRPGARPSGVLAYPGKVAWLADGGLAIADTAHHRVLVLDADHRPRLVIGTRGQAGFVDGPKERARFSRPQGLAEHRGALYVADVDNHAVRRIDLASGAVSTVAGTGRLGTAPLSMSWSAARAPLRSPWDVAFVGERLFVALAGSHQIAELDVQAGRIRAFAGSGREARLDGPRAEAAFAQPSALSSSADDLFVLDSETSSVRALSLRTELVRTIVGQDLFVFGDVDGPRAQVRLQHPLGLAFDAGSLLVADTYNEKIKRIDPRTGDTRTVWTAQNAGLAQPGGLAARDGVLAVANTDAHAIVLLGPGDRVARVPLDSEPSSARVASPELAGLAIQRPELLRFDGIEVSRAAPALRIALRLPPGTELNREAPFSLVWSEQQGLQGLPAALESTGAQVQGAVSVPLSLASGASNAVLRGAIDLVVCDGLTHRVCVPWTRRLEVSMRTVDSAQASSGVTLDLPEAR